MRLKVLLFASASFVGAFLLFVVQPMMGRAVLPLLGGSPSTWSTCLFFFQLALLGGYLYAHLGIRLLGPRRLVPLHFALVAASAFALPAAVPSGWTPPTDGSPVGWLLALLAVSVGVPFFLLSTTAPLVQRWYAAAGGHDAEDPYFLYAASNLGSLGALLAYPFAIQPWLGLENQTGAWSVGFGLWALLVAGCGVWLLRAGGGSAPEDGRDEAAPEPSGEVASPSGRSTFTAPTDPGGVGRTRLHWVLLAFAPSSLLLGVTTHLTTDVAAAPLLWIVPLALYLVSFIVAFARRPPLSHRRALRWQPLLVIPLVVAWFWGIGIPTVTEVLLHLAGFSVTALVCHGELVRLRPRAEELSDFYLWIATGGVLGGFFNAVLAPHVFDSSLEYPLILVLSLLLRPGERIGAEGPRARVRELAVPLAVGTAGLAVLWAESHLFSGEGGRAVVFVLMGGVAVACLFLTARPTRLALAVGALLLAGWIDPGAESTTLLAERSFFGIHRVTLSDDGRFVTLYHGTTIHGAQSRDRARRLEPLTYYRSGGPLDELLDAVRRTAGEGRRVGVLGLGAGAMACLGTEEEAWTFFEVDPVVIRIARDPELFTYLSSCPPAVEVVPGDARASLREDDERRFDVLVGDAFSSDAIPVHLMTTEALELYLDRLAPDGVLVFHISNRHMRLEPVLAAAARELDLTALARVESLTGGAEDRMLLGSHWVAMAREPEHLGSLETNRSWRNAVESPSIGAWTDDRADVVGVMEWEF